MKEHIPANKEKKKSVKGHLMTATTKSTTVNRCKFRSARVALRKDQLMDGNHQHSDERPRGIKGQQDETPTFLGTFFDFNDGEIVPCWAISKWCSGTVKLSYCCSPITRTSKQHPTFYVVRDDLLHPLVIGNKARKLDALFPLVEDHAVTDVTCGGCQSAHAAAVAVSCAERGLKSHLLLRGEHPEILTGYNLISTLYGNVTYIPRSLYARREEMLARHADLVAGNRGCVVQLSDLFGDSSTTINTSWKPKHVQMDARSFDENIQKVVIINEGAGDAVGLLGVFRLVQYLSENHLLGKEQVNAGTGTTAVDLGLGAMSLGLPWEVTPVMLADTIDGYRKQEERLISEFCRCCAFPRLDEALSQVNGGIVHWVERNYPRK
ncbi:unnamed protein product [Ilex paraguariensis]|uniref:Tryptophan synthase beta chain-like PALP domain-containing protein n=1 Tax=Ilex paraguariensis TaxID=185542 RepID=A0ABC8R423_9AQUA